MSELKATIVADLAFGDAGKGTILDALARRSKNPVIVRFNGGGQAAHNVITPEGKHHTFSQFGSGMFVDGAQTYLSRFMLVDPCALNQEAARLEASGVRNPLARLSVNPDALVVSPFQKAANRIREYLRGTTGHGTCGMGIGETMADALRAESGTFPDLAVHAFDLRNEQTLARKFACIQEAKREAFKENLSDLKGNTPVSAEAELLDDTGAPRHAAELYRLAAQRFKIVGNEYLARLGREGNLLFEGAQGVLLDEWCGFHPHTTWSTTTFANAETILRDIGFAGEKERLGVLRAYYTRHGAGPFPTEDAELTSLLSDPHNGNDGWQGLFRVGWFDFVLARYALAVCGGADSLAITNLDRFAIPNRKFCTAYECSDGVLIKLARGAAKDLVHQEGLTRLLQESKPLYEEAPDGDGEYLVAIERRLNIPISIASYGPTALDKQFLRKSALSAV